MSSTTMSANKIASPSRTRQASQEGVSDTSNYRGNNRLKGKIAAITGGSRAIGRTIVEVFAKEGATVYFCSRSKEEGDSVLKGLQDYKAFFSIVDVCKEDQIRNWMDDIGKKEGRIDIVVPNAASFDFGTVEEVESEGWDKALTTNVKGYANTVKYSIPWIRKVGKGSIVLLGSVQSFKASKSYTPYGVTKAAILQLGRCLAMDYGEENIRVNVVCPGMIDTPVTTLHAEKMGKSREEMAENHMKKQFLKRLGSTLDVAYATLFLASDESSFITGTSLVVDGGLLAA